MNDKIQSTDSCATCGSKQKFPDATFCNLCWEVESRLRQYLKSEGGRRYAAQLLAEAE